MTNFIIDTILIYRHIVHLFSLKQMNFNMQIEQLNNTIKIKIV
jgi:hypothetical protein